MNSLRCSSGYGLFAFHFCLHEIHVVRSSEVKTARVLLAANPGSDADVSRLLERAKEFKVLGPVGALKALRVCATKPPTAIVIQRDLRDVSGVELCRLLRGRQQTETLPILLFDSRHCAEAPVAVSEANDHVRRAELAGVADRLRLLLQTKRNESSSRRPVSSYEGRHITANFLRVAVTVDGSPVDLTRRELELLRFLVTYKNHVISREDLLLNVWAGENDGRSRTVDVHIRRLRVKLEVAGNHIQTVARIGYRFNEK